MVSRLVPDGIKDQIESVDDFAGEYVFVDFDLDCAVAVIGNGYCRVEGTGNAFFVELFLYQGSYGYSFIKTMAL